MKKRDDFHPTIVEALAKRASYICSNPNCRSLTLFPSQTDATKTIFLGIAAHITAAAPGGPRYDPLLTPEKRSSIDNGIFLCTTCASLIDKNNGADFSTETLIGWKNEHELWVSNNLNKSMSSLAESIQIVSEKNRRQDILHVLVHELYVNLNVLLDNKFSPSDEQLGKPYIYPRLLVSTTDNAIASGTFRDSTDKDLFKLLYSWKEIAYDFNNRLNITEQNIFGNSSRENVMLWQTKLSRTGRTLPSVKDALRNLLNILLEKYADESGIDRTTILFG